MGFEELKMKLGDWELRVENGIGGVEDETWEWEEIKREEYVANASQNLKTWAKHWITTKRIWF